VHIEAQRRGESISRQHQLEPDGIAKEATPAQKSVRLTHRPSRGQQKVGVDTARALSLTLNNRQNTKPVAQLTLVDELRTRRGDLSHHSEELDVFASRDEGSGRTEWQIGRRLRAINLIDFPINGNDNDQQWRRNTRFNE
jgi:hypothetical protein